MIAVIGLGPIGAGVGTTLVAAGLEVLGIDLDEERAARWGALTNAPVATRLEDVRWSELETVVIAVRMAAHMDAALAAIPPGDQTFIVLTTLPISYARALPGLDRKIIEAPVSGGAWSASSGTLSVFLHSAEAMTETEQRVLDSISSRIFRFDEYGHPAVAKLANNTLAAYNAFATEAMLAVASELGLNRADFLDVISQSSGQNWMAEHFDLFPEDLLHKDVSLLSEDVVLPAISPAAVSDWTPHFDASRRGLAEDQQKRTANV
jgi:3-hydroxyisobutyrate dehydrogenase-like beta-hydroxyacid dehydrogenase